VRAKGVCKGGISKATLPEVVTPFGGKLSRIQVPTMQCKFNNMCERVRDLNIDYSSVILNSDAVKEGTPLLSFRRKTVRAVRGTKA
jgi:hypothetical protein